MNFDALSEKEQRYESMFLSILQNEERIEPFLDAVFKFLYRKTDFFLLQNDPQQAYGFPDKVARQIVLKTFDKYNSLPKNQLEDQVKQSVEPKIETKVVRKEPVIKQKEESIKETSKIETLNGDNIDESLKKKQEYFQSNADSYNGAIRDNYSWSQSIKDIDVKLKVSILIEISQMSYKKSIF